MKKRAPKPVSIPYYIEQVVGYGSKHRADEQRNESYSPIMLELLLSILISVRAIRYAFLLVSGAVIAFLIGAALKGF